MTSRFRRSSLAWLALAALALSLLIAANHGRIGRMERVSHLVAGAKPDDASATGYTHGTRNLLIPQNHQASQPWIIETQQMLAAGQWRLERAAYDNAPAGRAVERAPAYRIWLRLVAAAEQKFAGLPGGRAVERASLHADPALLLAFGLLTALLVAWRFGAAPAGLFVAGLVLLFPFGTYFQPGHPHPHALALAGALLGGVTLTAGLHASTSRRAAFIWLGVGGALLAGATAWLGAGLGPEGSGLSRYTQAESLAGWIGREGLNLPLLASVLPLLLVPAAWWLARHPKTPEPSRRTLWITLGLAAALAVLAGCRLRWWGLLDVSLLGLLVAVAAALPAVTGENLKLASARLALLALFLPGAIWLWPQDARKAGEDVLSPVEARAMIERDLALWLAHRSPGATVYAPPTLSASLAYYGGLPVIASPYAGNDQGLALAVRIAGANSVDEMQALVQQRNIRYVILPSWDLGLDEFARAGSTTPEKSLVALLRQWLPPRWLRPVAYELPQVEGFESDTVFVFEVIEPQENAAALGHLAEYFVDMKQPELAARVSGALAQAFASDPGALIARAQVALARADGPALAAVMNALLPAIADGKDEDLTWERRANLALVLAQVKRSDLAKAQVRFCLEEADEDRLRALSTVSLYRLLVLSRAYGIAFPDAALHAKALALLPEELSAQLPK